MSAQNVLNVSAYTGQLMIGVQALVCISAAVACIVAGGTAVGNQASRDRVPATVLAVDDYESAALVQYAYGNRAYKATFTMLKQTGPGDVVWVLVNPSDPKDVYSEDISALDSGVGLWMIFTGVAMAFAAWYAVKIVSSRRNIAAAAGILSVVQALFGL